MVSVVSAGTALRIAARILLRFARAASGALARYSSTFLGAILAFARTRRLLAFTFFTRSSFPDDWRVRTLYLFPDESDDCRLTTLIKSLRRAARLPPAPVGVRATRTCSSLFHSAAQTAPARATFRQTPARDKSSVAAASSTDEKLAPPPPDRRPRQQWLRQD